MNEWQQNALALDKVGNMSRRQIAETLGVPKSTVSDFLRNYDEMREDVGLVTTCSAEGHDNSRILCISDMHIPYHHENLIPFLTMLKERYKPTRVICLGDELKSALPVIKELKALFPIMDLIDSNHGSMVYRKSKHHGIPRSYIRSYNEVLGVDEGWQWHNDLTIELPDGQKVYFHHGKSSDAVKTSQAMSMSHVCGHFHESFGVRYWANPNGLYWAINSGCLIDDKALAFSYNNVNLKRPIIGTSLIIDGYPVMEAMPL